MPLCMTSMMPLCMTSLTSNEGGSSQWLRHPMPCATKAQCPVRGPPVPAEPRKSTGGAAAGLLRKGECLVFKMPCRPRNRS